MITLFRFKAILKSIWITGFLSTFLLLSGCVSTDISDLDQYVQETLARPGGRIEPLPEIKPYEAYAYQSAEDDARDPFVLFYAPSEDTALIQEKDSGLTEEMENEIKHRNKEELEQFELDSLRMVGTMENEDSQWGIIQDPEGSVHRIRVGNYMGRNTGKILNVFEDKIELREIVRNSQGRWEERQAAIALEEQ
ncbi:MAG: pilus assembly protein PilP [Gammaproteobacteria bacterium]|nr:MAG: pilus assembly protein PilP [Gammaproteobacteria bacterium]RKZ71534.1 MAG: pilus assembly protein PilP [Gammaproteobacteria bacterium]